MAIVTAGGFLRIHSSNLKACFFVVAFVVVVVVVAT